MMMVPRPMMQQGTANMRTKETGDKSPKRRRSTRPDPHPRQRKPSPGPSDIDARPKLTPATPSAPVRIPSSRDSRASAATRHQRRNSPPPIQSAPSVIQVPPRRKESVRDVLSATAIPMRKRPKGRAVQRLPDGDHVAEFSRLLLQDVKPGTEGVSSGSQSNPQFDGLFGNLDELVEGQFYVGSEGLETHLQSPRSMSSESMPSLASPEDFPCNEIAATSPSGRKSPPDRRPRRVVTSETCVEDHPLIDESMDEAEESHSLPDMSTLSTLQPPEVKKAHSNSFKSQLSASLRALKSAAQSVSNLTATPPALHGEDLLSFSAFSFQPGLTDDKRPPPSAELPSPALRRYLNPLPPSTPPDSPRHLHFWHEERRPSSATKTSILKSKKKSKKSSENGSALPSVVALQSCIPPAVRTAHASSPPIWLAPDGTPSNKHTAHTAAQLPTAPGMPRQREPRENRDFLRVLVAEMNMRRAGKFEGPDDDDDDRAGSSSGPGRAVLWLPPIKEDPEKLARRKSGKQRWDSWVPE